MRHLSWSLALVACNTSLPEPSQLSVTVEPLTLSGIVDARYRVDVENRDHVAVFTREITSATSGDSAGAATYVGPCDASANPNYVTVTLLSLSDGAGPLAADRWVQPPPVTQTATCVANGDSAVSFALTVARSAEQGFFDVAVAFDDIFCAAKLDCGPSEADDLLLLHDGDVRSTTAVLGFACTAGPDATGETRLYLDHIQVDCEDGSLAVVPVDRLGNIDLDLPPADDGAGYLFGAAVYRDVEDTIVSWNVALGLDRARFGSAGRCTLTAIATASDGAFPGEEEAVLTPAGAIYPIIRWDAVLSDDGVKVCRQHPLDQTAQVATDYLTEPHRFGQAFAPSRGVIYGLPALDLVSDDSNGELGAGQSGTIVLTVNDGGVPALIPSGGGYVSVTSDNPGCVSAPALVALTAGAPSVAVPITATGTDCTTTLRVSHPVFGDAAVPVSVYGAPDLGPLTIVERHPADGHIGEGLGAAFVVRRENMFGSELLEVESLDPAHILLATSPSTPAKTKIRVSWSSYTTGTFWARAVPGSIGVPPVRIVARSVRHTEADTLVTVVPLDLAIVNLLSQRSIHAAATLGADAFQIAVGVTDDAGDFVRQYAVTDLPLDVTRTGDPIGTLELGATFADAIHPTIVAGQRTTATAGSQSAFVIFDDPPELGTITIGAALTADHVVRGTATSSITTLTNTIALEDPSATYTLGLGLQRAITVRLVGAHDDTPVLLTSSEPDRVLFATDRMTLGEPMIELDFDNLDFTATVYVQSTPGELGDVELFATAPQFIDGRVALEIGEPTLVVSDVLATRGGSTLTAFGDDPFRVLTAIPTETGYSRQYVAPAFGPLTIALTTSSPSVTADPVTVSIAVGADEADATNHYTPPVIGGPVTTTASAPGFADGSATTTLTIATATVSVANVSGSDDGRVAGGLTRALELRLSHATPTSLSFSVTSSDPSKVRLAGSNVAPSNTITLTVPANATTIPLWLHGVFGTTGTSTLTLRCETPGCPIADATRVAALVQPRANVLGVSSSTTTSAAAPAAPDAFQVEVGFTDSGNTFRRAQVSAATSGLAIPLSISGNGQLKLEHSNATTGSYTLAAGLDLTPTNALRLVWSGTSGTAAYVVSAGNASYQAGTTASTTWKWNDLKLVINTTVLTLVVGQTRGIPVVIQSGSNQPTAGNGVIVQLDAGPAMQVAPASSGPWSSSAQLTYTTQSSRTFYLRGVSVGSAAVTASVADAGAAPQTKTFTVGAASPNGMLTIDDDGDTDQIAPGMQQSYRVRFATSTPAGVTLTMTSSDPSRVLFATADTVSGSSTLVTSVSSSQSSKQIYIQTVAGADTDIEIFASATNYTDGSLTIRVGGGMLFVTGVDPRSDGDTWTTYPDDIFQVQAGVPSAGQANGLRLQYATPGTSGVPVTCAASGASIGIAYSNTVGNGLAYIPVNTYQTAVSTTTGFVHRTTGGISGAYSITCTSPGFSSSTSPPVSVTSTPITVTMRPTGSYVDARVGKALMREFDVVLSKKPANNQVFTVRSLDLSKAIASSTDTPVSAPAHADITFTNLSATRSIWLHGANPGNVTLEVTCQTCSLGPTQYVAEVVLIRADVTELIDHGIFHTQSVAVADQYRIDIGAMHVDGVRRSQRVSPLFSPLLVPVSLVSPSSWTLANSSASFTNSTAAVVQSITFPARQAAGTHTAVVRAGGVGYDPASTTSTATVVVRQLHLGTTSVAVDNDITTGQAFSLDLLDPGDQAIAAAGTVSISVTGVKVSATSTGSGSGSATLTFSSGDSSRPFYIRAGSVAAGTYSLTATWTGNNPAGVTSLSTTLTVY